MSKLVTLLMTTALALTAVHAWRLITSHTSIVPRLTENVSMECFYSPTFQNPQQGNMSLVLRIRLLKQRPHGGSWSLTAGITVQYSTVHDRINNRPDDVIVSKNGLATGNLGRLNESFLSVTWPVVTEDMIGRYLCEIDGLTGPGGKYALARSDVKNIMREPVAVDNALDMVFKLKDSSDQRTTELMTQVTDMVEGVKSQNVQERTEMVESLKEMAKKIEQLKSENVKLREELSRSVANVTDQIDVMEAEHVKKREAFSDSLRRATSEMEDVKSKNDDERTRIVESLNRVTSKIGVAKSENVQLHDELSKSLSHVEDEMIDLKSGNDRDRSAFSHSLAEVSAKIDKLMSENIEERENLVESLAQVRADIDDMKFRIARERNIGR